MNYREATTPTATEPNEGAACENGKVDLVWHWALGLGKWDRFECFINSGMAHGVGGQTLF